MEARPVEVQPSNRPAVPTLDSFAYLEKLCEHFQNAGFTFSKLQELFPDTTLTGRDASRMDAYRMSIEESNKSVHRLAQGWLLRDPLERSKWNEMLGSEMVLKSLSHGLLDGSALTHLEACFDIQPALNGLILTDPKFRHHGESDQKGVYYLGSDSYALVNTVPRTPVDSALDLFTGSGVHAVLAASHAERVVGVDINSRAVSLATANAAMNRRSPQCTFLEGDLFQPVEGRRFDLITANPPFVPTPDEDLALYRSGGESGEFLTAQVLARLHEFLNPGGTLVMVTNYPIFEEVGVIDHHRSLLGVPEQFGIALLHSYTFSREAYIQMHLAPTENPQKDRRDRARWLESYRRNKIIGMGFGVLVFRHLLGGKAWSARKDGVNLVHKPMSDDVSRWLQGLTCFSESTPIPAKLAFHPEARLYKEKRTGTGVLAWNSEWPTVELSASETETAWTLADQASFACPSGQEPLIRKLGSEGALLSVTVNAA